MKCKQCDKEFDSKRKDAKFCGDACTKRNKRNISDIISDIISDKPKPKQVISDIISDKSDIISDIISDKIADGCIRVTLDVPDRLYRDMVAVTCGDGSNDKWILEVLHEAVYEFPPDDKKVTPANVKQVAKAIQKSAKPFWSNLDKSYK